MVLKATLKTDFTLMNNVNAFVENGARVAQDVADEVAERNRDTVLRIMGEYPKRLAVHPFQFATERSRRKYFAMIRAGEVPTDGTRYIRQNKLKKSWAFILNANNNGVSIIIKSDTPYARWVGGSMALSKPSLARKTQVAGHTRTGWQLWVDRINPLFESIEQDFRALYKERAKEVYTASFSRRGYSTPKTRIKR